MNTITCVFKRKIRGSCTTPLKTIIQQGIEIDYFGEKSFFKAPYKVIISGNTFVISDGENSGSFNKTQFQGMNTIEVEEKLINCLCVCSQIKSLPPRIPDEIVTVTISETVSSGQVIVEDVVSDLGLGSNTIIQLATDVTGINGVVFNSPQIIGEDLFSIVITNINGADDVVIPELTYHIYKN